MVGNTNITGFRCRKHGISALQCHVCNPKRKLGTRVIELDKPVTNTEGKVITEIRARKGMYRTISRKQADHIPEDIGKYTLDIVGTTKRRQKKIRHHENLLDYLHGVSAERINKALHLYENS